MLKKYSLLGLALIISIGLVALPRLWRMWEYSKVISSLRVKPSLNAPISWRKVNTDATGMKLISLFYAELMVAREVLAANNYNMAVNIYCKNVTYTVMEPFTEIELPSEAHGGQWMQLYEAIAEMGRSEPETLINIGIMSQADYQRHLRNIILKCSQEIGQRGIELYDRAAIKAIIFLGRKAIPNRRLCIIIDKKSGISQGIYIEGGDRSELDRYTDALMESYNPLLKTLPSLEELRSGILSAVKVINNSHEEQGS